MNRRKKRGQAHTLEGVVAALLLVASLVFALQSTAVTPLSASTSSQHIENQEQSVASGILSVAKSDGSLRSALLYWDESNSSFHGLLGGAYTNDADYPKDFTLGQSLITAFSERGIAYNVKLVYRTGAGDTRERQLVYRGEPSDNAVTTSRVVTLYDDDVLNDADGTLDDAGLTVNDTAANFYAPDAGTDSDVYNVFRVEITVWRM